MHPKNAFAIIVAAALFVGNVASAQSAAVSYEDLSDEDSDLLNLYLENSENFEDTDDTVSDDSHEDDESFQEDTSDLPSKVDLRERGIVPPVRDQDPWGTCWGFGSIAACEISILSDLGLTCEEFREKYGYDLDLSERHLVWFATDHLPDVDSEQSIDDEYAATQPGEGIHNIAESTDPNEAHYNRGSHALIAASVFSAGIGPVMESDVPYTANDGELYMDSDWSVPESTRFTTEFNLLDSNILPSPVGMTEGDDFIFEYAYNEAATEAIKREIVNGHAVAIAYHADTSMPTDLDNYMRGLKGQSSDPADTAADNSTSEEETLLDSFLTNRSVEGMTEEQMLITAKAYIRMNEDEQTAQEKISELDNGITTAEEILTNAIFLLALDDDSDDDTGADSEPDKIQYINTDTSAQYTDDASENQDHCVCIIGYDDDYPVENFLPDHQPPAPGAWICRNSWGTIWGDEGYFYLSYYDQTISDPESFIFDVSDFDNQTESLTIMEYDFMQTETMPIMFQGKAESMANVFTNTEDNVLSSAGLLTAAQDVDVLLSVYLLNEDAVDPNDGTLLDVQILHFPYAGYHRVDLDGNYLISSGARISIVVSQTVRSDGEEVSVMPINTSPSYKEIMELTDNAPTVKDGWYSAVVNEGESFIFENGSWIDWKEALETMEEYSFADSVVDNHSLKLYLSPYDEIRKIHQLDRTDIDENDRFISVCDEDGYTVIHS